MATDDPRQVGHPDAYRPDTDVEDRTYQLADVVGAGGEDDDASGADVATTRASTVLATPLMSADRFSSAATCATQLTLTKLRCSLA